MTLNAYVKKRNGVPMGYPKSLKNNLYRSLGAKNFSIFWHYWNPIFGYYLGKYVFKPLKQLFPVGLSLLLTFVFCGMIHDAVTMLIRGRVSVFFSVWFLIMGSFILITSALQHNFSRFPWHIRATINLTIILFCLIATIGIIYFLPKVI